MAITFRPASAADMPSVLELFQKRDARRYTLEDVAGYVDEFDAARAIGWLAFDEDQAIGMSMVYRRRVVAAGRTFEAGYWGNLFVDPAYRKVMVYPRLPLRMLKAAQTAGLDFVWTCTRRTESSSVHLGLGCAELGKLAVLAKPLRPAALLARRRKLQPGMAALSRVPDAVFAALNRLYMAPRGRRREVESLSAATADLSFWAEQRTACSGAQAHDVWDANGLRARVSKTLEGDSYELVVARRGGQVVASAAFRLAERQGYRIGVLMDLCAAEANESELRSVLAETERRIHRAGGEVVLHLDGISDHTRGLLRRSGYLRSPETYSMLVWPAHLASDHMTPLRADRWRFSFIDHDAL